MIKIFTLLPAGNKTADVVPRSSCGRYFCTPTTAALSWLGIFSCSCMGSSSLSMQCHPFAASVHCSCYLSQAGDPSSSFHLLIWHLISSLWSRICPGFHLLTVHCPHMLCTPKPISPSALQSLHLYLLQSLLFLCPSLITFPLQHKLLTICTNKFCWLKKRKKNTQFTINNSVF